MTLKQLFVKCSNELDFTGCGSFEALCLFNDFLGITKEQIYLDEGEPTDIDLFKINNAVTRRKNGEPLQYIVGKWDFYDLTFNVGEGVLIPRPETEMLVDFALEKLKKVQNPVVYDLCAGSGCIGLTIAKHRPDATVFLLEKEESAYSYLISNKSALSIDNANVVKGDLFSIDTSIFPDAYMVLSNPPYIESDVIGSLQREVQFEPKSALDGGLDGLDFYKCLASKWAEKVVKNGYMAFECGEMQSEPIINIFSGKYIEKEVIFDFNNIDRIVTFRI